MYSLNAQRNLNKSQSQMGMAIQKLSSGLRINSAKDDAAGMAVAEGMTSKIRGLDVAARNANDGISLAQTAEAALGEITNNLQRIRELSVQSANGTLGAEERGFLDTEVQELGKEIGRIIDDTEFNGAKVFGSASVTIQVGADKGETIAISAVNLSSLKAAASGFSVASVSAANKIIATGATSGGPVSSVGRSLNSAITARSAMGATQNRFESVINNINSYKEGLQAARSRITDTDYAAETANLARAQVLQQAGVAMVAQANQIPSGVLRLLG
jgi:flagellin